MSRLGARVGGRCAKLGDNVNSDVIIPGRYLISIDPKELAQHAFEPLGSQFQQQLRESKVLIAGKNFGCGSAREQAATCLSGAGIRAVVARSFARVFFRNAVNTGLLAIVQPEVVSAVESGDDVYVDLREGRIEAAGAVYRFPPYPESILRILEAGGLIPYLMTRGTAR